LGEFESFSRRELCLMQKNFSKGEGLAILELGSRILGGLLGGVMGIGLGVGKCDPAIALDPQALLLLTQPLTSSEISLLQQGAPLPDPSWVTAETISQTGLTTPSLWWAKQQFGGELLDNWIAKPGTDDVPNRVDLLVNQQVWTSYDYLDRYAFLNQMGRVAQDFGYSTRVFDGQGQLLGAYICDFDLAEPRSTSSACRVFLDPSGVGAVRGVGTTSAF